MILRVIFLAFLMISFAPAINGAESDPDRSEVETPLVFKQQSASGKEMAVILPVALFLVAVFTVLVVLAKRRGLLFKLFPDNPMAITVVASSKLSQRCALHAVKVEGREFLIVDNGSAVVMMELGRDSDD